MTLHIGMLTSQRSLSSVYSHLMYCAFLSWLYQVYHSGATPIHIGIRRASKIANVQSFLLNGNLIAIMFIVVMCVGCLFLA